MMVRIGHGIGLLAWAAAQAVALAEVDYVRDIKPVLRERCVACHGALKQQAGLRIDTAARLAAGGKQGPVAVAGQPEQSRLLARLASKDPEERMPLDAAPLLPEQIAAIREWIASGMIAPSDEQGEDDPRNHWAFQQIRRPALPDAATRETAIDAFLELKQAKLGLHVQPEAERGILMRRLYLDLTGLPPTVEQLQDARPYAEIVEELLRSPQHGERWARHWMDIWRYTDWYGLGAQLRNSQKHLWHWRDWIIESLVADKGYDRMIQEMLAGDELVPGDAGVVRATGYLARNYYLFNRTTWLDDTIEHTGKAFLGLTLNCAKCHDHKYDPIAMVDYYNFRAIFEPHQVRLDPVPGVIDFEKDGIPRVFDNHPNEPTHLHVRGDPAHPDKSVAIKPAVPSLFASFAPPIVPVSLPMSEWAPGSRDHVQRDHLAAARAKIQTALRELDASTSRQPSASARPVKLLEAQVASARAELANLEAVIAADRAALTAPDAALVKTAARRGKEMRVAQTKLEVLTQELANDTKKLAAARKALAAAEKDLARNDSAYTPLQGTKKALETPEHNEKSYPAIYPSTSTGRRLMLARWITVRENPLTARVAVNHVWTRHFGEPLVETVFDFGRQAPRPEHQDLLDWLAAEFMDSGWSFRHLHRLIVNSAAYRRTSTNAGADPATLAADPTNRLHWRAFPRRMESQVIRDSLLSLAGALDPAVGGPPLPIDRESRRRGIYFVHSRDEEERLLSMFDNADILQCYRRSESVVPQHALAMANSALSLDMAEKIARRIQGTDRETFVGATFAQILGRAPNREERAACQAYCEELSALESVRSAPDSEVRIRARLVHALLNHNDFITIR
jgi:mono/diheme cytochrome c family protein